MNTRKIILLTVPVIVVVLLALAAILTLVFSTLPSKTAAATPTPATEAVQEQMAPPAVLTPEAAPAEGSGKPKVIYENHED